ncbi:multidrug effflux MFS transporter [Microbacterium sp. SLBN-146]|uniref:multidrug effflux MFS transporter n=1 Tax=Microbacterium sp. SLBN-146 TaxID=2768457 RepID=UPI00114F9579|nr:multidrug effflux MFS transporter [Microbacterium sp. SLBN-146]TQJ29889.1 DHA1 family bicyclomycin/chloramphenicol resistance-like MFS transporter [Microbacterium sp. SLBN-146]
MLNDVQYSREGVTVSSRIERTARGRFDPQTTVSVSFGLMASLTAIMSMTAYSVDSFLPAFPVAADAFGVQPSALQLTLSAFLIGIAAGQLVFGPLSDRLGRRGPLIAGAAVCAAAAIVAALAPDVTTLIIARFVQGFAGSSGTVISRAIIRDRTVGDATARTLASLAVGVGALNVFSPMIGGLLVHWFGWRGPLWFLAAVAVALLLVVVAVVPETHHRHHRETSNRWLGLPGIVRHLRNRVFLVYVVVQAGSYATLMAYVSASPFVYQDLLGFDGAQFGLLFSVNAAAAVTVNFVANKWLRRLGAKRLVLLGLGLSFAGTGAVAVLWTVDAPVPAIAVAITCAMAPLALNGPNLIGLALNRVTTATGSAAATIGFVQFCAGSAVAPFVGIWGTTSLLPMCLTMMGLAAASILALLLSRRSERAIAAAARAAERPL